MSERAPRCPVAINHHQLNYSHALPPHCPTRPRKTRRVSSNRTFKSSSSSSVSRDQPSIDTFYFPSIANRMELTSRLMSDRYFSSILPPPFERWSTNSFTTISFFHSIERKKKWDFRRRQFLNYASNCAQYPIRSKTSPFRRMRLFLVSFNLPIDELEFFFSTWNIINYDIFFHIYADLRFLVC